MPTMSLIYRIKELTGQCPFPVNQIFEEKRQEEFIVDYSRLRERCGFNPMLSTFMLYLMEQAIESRERPPVEIKIKNIGYKNTSEIIARFVKNGWMDYYLADFDYLAEQPLFLHLGKSIFISQIENENIGTTHSFRASTIIKKPSKKLDEFVRNLHDEKIKHSKYIPPSKIRELFAQIDKRYS